jgi:hypothetical protein
MHNDGATRSADIVRQADFSAFNLPFSSVASQLLGDLHSLFYSGRPHWMPACLQPPACVYRDFATDCGLAYKRRGTSSAFFEESKIFNRHYLSDCKAVMHLSYIDV